jgi:hypothetical protein
MARGRNLAALGALLGAGAMAASRKGDTPFDEEADVMNYIKKAADSNWKLMPGEEAIVRRRALLAEPGGRNLVLSEGAYPVLTGSGKFLRSGMKKGGKVTASRRGDGIAQRGKTRGKMV